jgi:hypothetical protein
MGDGVHGDVGHVVIGEPVRGLLAAVSPGHQAGAAQDAQVLRRKRLRDPEDVDQFMDALGSPSELEDDRQTVGSTQCPQKLDRVGQLTLVDRPSPCGPRIHCHINRLASIHMKPGW